MRIAEASRGLSLRSVIIAAFLVVPNGSLFADAHLDPSLQDCVRHLPEAKLEDQLLCLHRLRQVGRAASAATLLLTEMLSSSDGTTDHALVASMLDVLRSLGPVAAPAAETLSALLPHRCKLYRDRDKMLVARLRAHILLTLSDIGIPSSSLPTLIDVLAHVDERMSPLEAGASARAVRSLGPRGRAFAPYLLEAISARISEEEFSLERYDPKFQAEEATTIQIEAVRALGGISSMNDEGVLVALRRLADDRPEEVDPRVMREAFFALDLIKSRYIAGGISARDDVSEERK